MVHFKKDVNGVFCGYSYVYFEDLSIGDEIAICCYDEKNRFWNKLKKKMNDFIKEEIESVNSDLRKTFMYEDNPVSTESLIFDFSERVGDAHIILKKLTVDKDVLDAILDYHSCINGCDCDDKVIVITKKDLVDEI